MTVGQQIFSVSGLRGLRRTTAYRKLRLLLPEKHPGTEFAFLGNPFRDLTHPLLLPQSIRDRDATSRLLWCWEKLNECAVSQLVPALSAHKVVVTDGFGLDGLLYAAFRYDTPEQNRQAAVLHHGIVQLRIKAQNIRPPLYFILQADDVDTVDRVMTENMPDLLDIEPEERKRYIGQQIGLIEDYFLPSHGQRRPMFFDPSLPIESVVESMASAIGEQISE